MKKNGWKVIPLLLAVALAASFFGCSKKEKDDNMPTVGTKTSVEQYTFGGISAPSTTGGSTEPTTKSSSGGSYIGGGNSYMGGYQAANRLPTAASPNAGGGSSSITPTAGATKKPSSADISQILGGFTGSLSMDNLGEINKYLLEQGIDTNALGISIAQLVSGLVDAKENESKQDAGTLETQIDGLIDDLFGGKDGGTTAKSGS